MIRYQTMALLYTRTCPLSCRHCIIESSPKATGKMSPEKVSEYIKILPRYTDQMCFTGGEPMLYYNEILPLIREGKEAGLLVTMVTGAGWVSLSKPQIVYERIASLKEAGLDFLTVSWDTYHEEFASPEQALLVMDAAKQAGLRIDSRGVISKLGVTPRIADQLVQINVEYEHQTLVRLGSARSLPDEHFFFVEEQIRGGCSTVTRPSIEPDGNVYTCCGPARSYKSSSSPLLLGNTNEEDLGTILERAINDPILEAISTVGPYGLFQLVKDDPALKDILPPMRKTYTGICEMCLDINDIPLVVQRLRERLHDSSMSKLMLAMRMYWANPQLRPETPISI